MFHFRDADAGFRIYQIAVIRKIANEVWINRNLISSELALRAVYSGFEVKENAGAIPPARRPVAWIADG